MLIQLKHHQLKELRKKWYEEQDGVCPILKTKIPFEQSVVDHQHKLKSEDADESGKGICRGAIDRFANALEGKISNNFKRLGLNKYIELPEFLRNLADYLEENKIHEETKYIHPSEAKRKPKIQKACYNRLKKAVGTDYKMPRYTGNLSKRLFFLFEKYDIKVEYYGQDKNKDS
jgi:hypothetical protein